MAHRAAKDGFPALESISEGDLETFDAGLKYQAIDPSSLTEGDLAGLREIFNDALRTRETARKVGRMKLKPSHPMSLTGGSRFGVPTIQRSTLSYRMTTSVQRCFNCAPPPMKHQPESGCRPHAMTTIWLAGCCSIRAARSRWLSIRRSFEFSRNAIRHKLA